MPRRGHTPAHPTRSYRSTEPLRVVGEEHDRPRLTPEALAQWRETVARLDAEQAEIIN